MPTNVVKTKDQEKKWNAAKKIAADSKHDKNYAYIMGIFKKMGGLNESVLSSIINAATGEVGNYHHDGEHHIWTPEEPTQRSHFAPALANAGFRKIGIYQRPMSGETTHLYQQQSGQYLHSIHISEKNNKVIRIEHHVLETNNESKNVLSFSNWIFESTSLDNDSRGKLHEILVAAHLNRLIHGELAHAKHFRDVKGRTPEEAHNQIVSNISESEYQTAHFHAVQAAEAIYHHLKSHHPEVLNPKHETRVSWTSLKSDHEKLTGQPDVAHSGGADVMISSHDKTTGELHHAVGVSLKIADNKITTGQTGSATTERILGMVPESLSKHDEDHRKNVAKILNKYGYDADNMSELQKHKIFKSSRDASTDKKRAMANEIRESSYLHAARKVKTIKDHLNSLPIQEQKSRLVDLIAPKHTFPTFQVATSPLKSETKIKNENATVSAQYKNAGKLSYSQSEGNGNSLLVKDENGKTLHRIEVRSKRPVAPSEHLIK